MSFTDFKSLNSQLETNLPAEGEAESGGVVLETGDVIVIDNVHPDPLTGYQPDAEDLLLVLPAVVATWHSHPGATSNLSVEDAETFINWPDLLHAIVGVDGVRWYQAKNGAVVNA